MPRNSSPHAGFPRVPGDRAIPCLGKHGIVWALWCLAVLGLSGNVAAQTQITETITNIARIDGIDGSGTPLTITDDASTDVSWFSHLTITPIADSTLAEPGDVRTFTHTFFNRGNFQETIQVEVTDTQGWLLALRSGAGLASTSTAGQQVTLAPLGPLPMLSPTSSSTSTPTSPQVPTRRGTLLEALSATSSRVAATQLTLGLLAPGDSVVVLVDVTVPLSASLGDVNQLSIVGHSLRVPSETTQATDTVHVADPQLDPLFLSVSPAGPVGPGELLRYQLQFGNPDPQDPLLNVTLSDVLVASLEYVEATQGTVVDEAFPGRSVVMQRTWNPATRQLTWTAPSLPPGFRGSLEVQARVNTGATEGERITNQVSARGGNAAASLSNRVETPVVPRLLQLVSASMVQDILPGDPVIYRLELSNLSESLDFTGAEVSFVLPSGFRYLEHGSSAQGLAIGSAPVQGKASLGVPLTGRVARFQVPLLPAGQTTTWTLAAAASERVAKGAHVAQAAANGMVMGDVPVSIQGLATVRVIRDFEQRGLVMGRVYIDEDENHAAGLQEGLPNVRLLLDDGTHTWTDARGRYHLEGIRPGVRVVRIDRSNLPTTLEFDREGRLAAGNDLTRFVDIQPGEIRNVDFRAVRKRNIKIRKFEIALGKEHWEFYEFSLFKPGQDKLRPEASRLLARLAAGTGPLVADSLRLYVGEPRARQRAAMTPVTARRSNVEIRITSRLLSDEAQPQTLLPGTVPFEDTAPAVPAMPATPGLGGPSADPSADLLEKQQQLLHLALGGDPPSEDTAPKVPEESLEQMARSASTEPAILQPADGSMARGDRTRIAVKFPRDLVAAVRVNGQAVGAALMGRQIESPGNGVAIQEYIGVPLTEGRNEIVLEVCDANGNCTIKRSTVLLPGEPQQLQVRVEATPADGRTEPMVQLVLLDAWDQPVSHGRFVTLEAEGGILGADADPRRPGHQVRLKNGHARVLLPPATRAEERRLHARFGNLETHQFVRLVPAPADWTITGVGEVSLAARPKDQPLTPDEALRGVDGRAGIFARGRVGAQSELTIGIDTERQRDELFAERDRQLLYPVLGDESMQGSAAPTRWPLFARIDVPEGHAQIGDFRAGWNQVELARFDRSLTGFDGTWMPEEGNAYVQGFIASTRQNARLDQFRGKGTSGPFVLQHRPMVISGERLTLETRDRIHTERVLASRPLIRQVDYTIDYTNGSILLKEPMPSADAQFNPNYLVVHYETIDAGEERPVFGMHGTATIGRHWQAGVTAVHEQTAWGSQTLLGTHGGWSPRSDMRFDYEYAHSTGLDRDQAFRIGWTGRGGPAQETRLYYRQVGAGFGNDSRTGMHELGTRKYGMEADLRAGKHGRVAIESWMQEDLIRGRDTWAVSSDYLADRKSWQFSVGHRLIGRKDTFERTLSNVLAVSTRRRLGSRLGVEAGAQKAIGGAIETHPSRLYLGGDARLSSHMTLRGRQEWDGSNMGRSATMLGLESGIGPHTALTSRVENVHGPFADRLTAWAGVRTRVPLSPTWTLHGSAEQGRVFTADVDRNTALSASVQWQNAKHQWMLQYEGQSAVNIRENALRTSASLRLGNAWTLVGREHWRHVSGVLGSRDIHDMLLAWAYRPVQEGRIQWLGSVRSVIDPNPWVSPGVSMSRTVGSLEGAWQMSRHYSLLAGVAHRFASTTVDAVQVSSSTSISHARVVYDIGGGFDASLGLRHRNRTHSASDWSWGGELGYMLMRDVWLVGGYNFVGFADVDLPTNVHSGSAGYLSFRFKFDERLLQ